MKTTSPVFRLPRGVQTVAAVLFFAGLSVARPAVFAADAKAAELMEQGVYSEETKGDFDAAIQFYQQVIAETDAGQALGAQAQFRLAMCYDKKKERAAAAAAFTRLIHDFPNQKELVALANEHLGDGAGLLPAPWVDGEDLWFNVNFQSGLRIGVAHYSVASDEINGRKIWRFGMHLFAAGVQQWSRMEADANSFRPIHCRWKHTLFGGADTTYTAAGADVRLKGVDGVKHVELSGLVYDNEQCLQLARRLAMSTGSSSAIKIFSGLGGGAVVPIELTVEARESVVVPAGTFDCLKVALNIGQTFWYSTDAHHYLVKFEFGGVIGELASVKQGPPAKSDRYDDPTHGFSVAVPAGWMSYRKEGPEEARRAEIVLLDSEAVGTTLVKVEDLGDFDDAARASIRGFAEHQISDGKKYYKEFAVRADSWTETTVAGRPAVSLVADAVQGKNRYVVCGVYAFVDGNAVDISTSTAPEDFEAFRPRFATIVASYKGGQAK